MYCIEIAEPIVNQSVLDGSTSFLTPLPMVAWSSGKWHWWHQPICSMSNPVSTKMGYFSRIYRGWRHGVVVTALEYQRSYSASGSVSTGMGDVYGFDSRRRHFISLCNQPTRSTQPLSLSWLINWVVSCNRMCVSSHGRRHLVKAYGWRPGVVDRSGGVFASCMLQVQLYVNACSGWPQFALQHHWLLPINCHFLRLYRVAGHGTAAVSSAIEESDLYPLHVGQGHSSHHLFTFPPSALNFNIFYFFSFLLVHLFSCFSIPSHSTRIV